MQMYMRTSPAVPSLQGTVIPVVEYLEKIPGVVLARAVRNAPYLLLTDPSELPLLEANAAWLTRTLGLVGSQLGKLLNGNAYVIGRSCEGTVRPCIEALLALGFAPDQVRSMVLRFPRLMSLKGERMQYTLRTLRDLGLDEEQLRKVLWRFPAVCK